VKILRKFNAPEKGEEAMLTSDQSIVEFKAGRAIADRLTQSTHRHYLKYAERMLAIYHDGKGRQRHQLHRQIESLFADEPDCPVRRIQAFCKLLDDRSVFQTDPDGKAAKLRLNVFSRVARLHPLVEKPDRLFEHDETKVKAQIADELGLPWSEIEKGLYADVMSFQRLEQFEGYLNASALLSCYNVAQLQACLYRAENMTVMATDNFKTIVRYAKLARLLHEIICLGPSHYRIVFSGPASILHETRRYGVNFAKFLPALLACKGWRMTATLKTPWNTSVMLTLSDKDGFTSHLPTPDEFDSGLEESFAEKFGSERDDWKLIREGEILHNLQKTFVPDFTFRHADGTQVLLEIIGFWTPEYLSYRRETLKQFRHHAILIAVPEKSLREGAHIGKNVLVYKTTLKVSSLMEVLDRIRNEKKS
jgi:predicted nuclease of restriction endonuclease-like RecB superfamily